MKLIDADILPRHGRRGGLVEWADIAKAPTVDAVPVVRCKDCINRYSSCPMITIHPDGSITFRAQDDWYCFMWKGTE